MHAASAARACARRLAPQRVLKRPPRARARPDRAGAAEALLEGGAAVDTLDAKGRGALHHAARYGSLDCLAVLAQQHADAFRPDADGRSPLDVAEDCARTEAAALLRKCAPAAPAGLGLGRMPGALLRVWGPCVCATVRRKSVCERGA